MAMDQMWHEVKRNPDPTPDFPDCPLPPGPGQGHSGGEADSQMPYPGGLGCPHPGMVSAKRVPDIRGPIRQDAPTDQLTGTLGIADNSQIIPGHPEINPHQRLRYRARCAQSGGRRP